MQAVSSVTSVSIIMKVWNALPHVRLCLNTLLHNTDGPCELIVIDNGSQPEVVEFLRGAARDDPRIRLIENIPGCARKRTACSTSASSARRATGSATAASTSVCASAVWSASAVGSR